MQMTDRVRKLRTESMEAIPHLSHERARLVTEAMKSMGLHSAPVRRALIFKAICEKKEIVISEGELIVGERGEDPKGTSTYPEICCHSLQDLEILDTRPKIPY